MADCSCRNCRRLEQENAHLREFVGILQEKLRRAQEMISKLKEIIAKLGRNSSNSSKPPSSDIVKPNSQNNEDKKNEDKGTPQNKRKIGGQPGHPRHERAPFTEEQIDDFHHYHLQACPDCDCRDLVWDQQTPPWILDQVVLPDKPVQFHRHMAYCSYCPNCQAYHYAQIPKEVQAAGLCDARLTAMLAKMKSEIHVSYSGLRTFCAEVLGFNVSRGYLAKLMRKTSRALKVPYEKLLELLTIQQLLNIDETSHKENGKRLWTWCFRAVNFVVFHIAESRSSAVLMDLLGERFNGVIGCDYFSAYRKFMREMDVLVQFCLAHLIRELKFLCEHPDGIVADYGKELLDRVRQLFKTIHEAEAAGRPPSRRRLNAIKKDIIDFATCPPQDKRVPKLINNIATRFRRHGHAYFTFLITPGMEPTNNGAEQILRFIVIDRRLTQGTRSPIGRRFCERMWTVIGTCLIQKRSVFEYLTQALAAYFQGKPAPPLVDSS